VTARGLLFAAIVAGAAAVFAFKAAAKMPDFEVYWRAAVRARAAEPLYRQEDEHYQFKYLPAFAIVFIPVGLLPLIVGKAIWFGLSAGLIPVLIAMSARLLPDRRQPAWLLAALTFVLMAKFYGHELVLGQVNLLFAAVICAAVLLLRHGRSVECGLLLALAVIIKPYAVLFVPWLAAQRETKALIAAAAGIGAALALPALIYGTTGAVALHTAWWETVTGSTAPNLLNADNVSLAAMFAKWFGIGRVAAAATAAGGLVLLAVAAGTFLLRRQVSDPAGLEAAMLLTLIPLLSPQGWDYVFLVATPAVAYVVNYDRALPTVVRALTWAALAASAVSLYDVMGRAAYARFMALSVISLCFIVVAGALAGLRIRRAA
jgi:hypothetical protein